MTKPLQRLKDAYRAHMEDPVDARDRPEAWGKLWDLEAAVQALLMVAAVKTKGKEGGW